ncbi:TonB-dependent receptor [Aliarcobacter vitoriensis]|uniref:TonB-dependent siderophore receptor n=2 Tax=Aliarcobacter vitoriensis TaxID=2011099 RepID=A0A366MS44_9BACT|nr:TonB-dependent siderophore receptor [Aliarcobacter vitoriensis]RBQ28162.1 TonB-dependent siderophore receptor [Aliarcobacter vitoriensis]
MTILKKSILSPVVALIICSNVYADNISYSLDKSSLKDAIEKISKKANIPYIANSSIFEGKTANAIKDIEGTKNALDKVLENSGLEAIMEDGAIIIKPLSSVKVINGTYILDDISVKSGKNGSAESGYLVEDVKTLGVWGNLSLQDTPYSMSIISSDFIENTIITNTNQIAKTSPVMTNKENASQNVGVSTSIRGIGIAQALVDGIPLPLAFGIGLKEVERVEVISGLSGFLYGSGNVGGVINYALKYPTLNPFTKVSVGNNGGKNYYTTVDTSQNINDKLSVRVNVAYQDGETAIENYEDEEKLIGVSFAYKPTDNLDFGLYYSHRDATTGVKPIWIITGKRPNASSFDTKKTYAPDWVYIDDRSDKVELKANYSFSDSLRLRTAYIYNEANRLKPYYSNNVNTNTSILTRDLYYFPEQKTKNDGAYAYLDGYFDTGSINHALTFGGSFGSEKFYSGPDYFIMNSPVNDINSFHQWNHAFSKPNETFLVRKQLNSNVVLANNITFNKQWSALVGVNFASMKQDSWNTFTKAQNGSYDKSALTPTLSLIYKPIEDLTTYITYMESLENGTVVNNKNDINDGKVFDPRVSKQYEIGAKYSINQDLLLSTALFRIERKNSITEYFANNGNGKTQVTSQDGEQINEGIEILLTGKATDNLTLMGGITYLSPKVEKATNKATEGKESQNVAKYQAKMYAEYRLPIEPKIFLNGGVYYTGTQWVDSANTQKLDAYTTVDFGARYETKLDGYDTTFRIYASNLTNEKYWANTTTLSDPRSVAFNVTLKF